MIRLPPRSTRTDTLCPTRRSSELRCVQFRVFLKRVLMATMLVVGFQDIESLMKRCTPEVTDQQIYDIVWELATRSSGDNTRYVFDRSEEQTSELQSLMRHSYAVFCLKHKKNNTYS